LVVFGGIFVTAFKAPRNSPVVGLGVLVVLLVLEVTLELGSLGGVGHLGVVRHRLDADHLALVLLVTLPVFHLHRKRQEETGSDYTHTFHEKAKHPYRPSQDLPQIKEANAFISIGIP